jgi:AAHS family 4-hydroxybenzoate transporter-like MFS transporter
MAMDKDGGDVPLLGTRPVGFPFTFGTFQKVLFVKLFVVVLLAEGSWNGLLPFLILDVAGRFDLPASQSGLYAVAFYGGEFFGAAFFGGISDRLGRRLVILASMLISAGAGLGCAACPAAAGPALLLGTLAILGFGIGGTIPSVGKATRYSVSAGLSCHRLCMHAFVIP